jgi:hypothetical protein
VKTLRAELLDRMLIWNETHLRHALRAYKRHCNLTCMDVVYGTHSADGATKPT